MISPSMRVAVSIPGRAMVSPSTKAFKALKMMPRFLKGEMKRGLTYNKTQDWDGGDYPQLGYFSDASLAGDPDTAKTQGGYCANPHGQAVSTFVSKQSSLVPTSTFHAETHFASLAARDIAYKRNTFTGLGFTPTGPTQLYIDNQATVLDAGSPIRKFSQKSKHFAISERFVHQMVDDNAITIIKISGKHHKAGALTKPFAKEPFQRYNDEFHAISPPYRMDWGGASKSLTQITITPDYHLRG